MADAENTPQDNEEDQNVQNKDDTDGADKDSSLSISLTPPILNITPKNIQDNGSDDSISEHLTSNSGSIENDRSFQEIEVSSQPNVLFNMPSVDRISQELQPNFVTNSLQSDNSIISLNYLNLNKCEPVTLDSDHTANVQSILQEIINNEQFHSDTDTLNHSNEGISIDIFAGVNLDDKSLTDYRKSYNENSFAVPILRSHDSDVDNRVRSLEEILVVKDITIAALNSELDSLKEISGTNSSSIVSSTEYKQLQDNYHAKLVEYNGAIIYKNDLIKQLSESLDQSVCERRELFAQIEIFKHDIAQLQDKLIETSKMLKEHECGKKEDLNNDATNGVNSVSTNICSEEQVAEHNCSTSKLEEELKLLREKLHTDKEEYEMEITRLRELLANIKCGSTEIADFKNELEAQHSREMEELRTYFEKKCVELEKNYSEEVFSQQSRKMSASSSSEAELNSEHLFTNPPGPGGDTRKNVTHTKEQLQKLKDNLSNFLSKINKVNFDEISEEEIGVFEMELNKCQLDFWLNSGGGEHLEGQLVDIKRPIFDTSKAAQEVGSSGEFEINEVIQSYERRLQEQVTLAKIDIISALESQIQRLASNEADEEEWPSELLQLRDRFSNKYELEIQLLKEEHQSEITRLKEEHNKILNGALERARRRSLKDSESFGKGELEMLKERDILKKQVVSLRNLLSELVKYFTQCEDELNNTLVDELLKQGIDKNVTSPITEDDVNITLNDSSNSSSSRANESLNINGKRVHLTPNFSDLINLIDNQQDETDSSKDFSLELKNELGMCLTKLRQDANAILALSVNISKPVQNENNNDDILEMNHNKNEFQEELLASLKRQLATETFAKEKLQVEINEAVGFISSLNKEKEKLEADLDIVITKENMAQEDLKRARDKVAELVESGRKEIVSVGYGEDGHSNLQGFEDTITIMSNLQDKARNMLAQSRSSADPTLLQLIEELCRVGERIKEESHRERNDLMLQIDAADKKYKITHKFLEEQAVEREQERDEAQKKIDQLNELLRDKDKEIANFVTMMSEVEHLEQQLRELAKHLEEKNQRCKAIESERNEAIEKIKVLRDIIRELEVQNEQKTKEVQEYQDTVDKLECIVDQQQRSLDELKSLVSLKDVSDVLNLRKHVEELESQLQNLRISAELAGDEGILEQIKIQLFEIEVALDKKTKDLEVLHSTGTNSCSSPSEDMSVRDVVRPQTPSALALDECEVPLQQLARLKEKLVRHSRAEETAIKRIRDLEMQVFGLKNELEETHGEKDYMKKQIQEQLVLISDLQIRLDEQRIRAEHIEKQTNTSLESRIYDLQTEILNLQEMLRNKEKAINHQELVLKDTQKRLADAENEITSSKDDDIVVSMQKELEALRAENTRLKTKISNDSQIVPNLVENIISDKNTDIEKLREKLDDTEKLLEEYLSLKLDMKDLQTLSNLRSRGSSLEQIMSIIDLSQPELVRRAESCRSNETIVEGHHGLAAAFKRNVNETVMLGASGEPEISEIEKIGPSNVMYTLEAPLGKPNSTEIGKPAGERRVHFEDTHLESLKTQCEALKAEVEEKNNIITEYELRLEVLNDLENKISKLQTCLDDTEKALASATKTFEKEQQELNDKLKVLGVELAEKKLQLSEYAKKIDILEQDSNRKDEMYLKLAREKRDMEQDLAQFKRDSFYNMDTVLHEKEQEIQALNDDHANTLKVIENLEKENDALQAKIEEHELYEKRICDLESERNCKLTKDLENISAALQQASSEKLNLQAALTRNEEHSKSLREQIKSKEAVLVELQKEVKVQKDTIADRECEIEILNEDMKRYQNELCELEENIKELKVNSKDLAVKDMKITQQEAKINELAKKLVHAEDVVTEKDKIIQQMIEDNNKLHDNLVTIQNKMKETGNILDLSNRLKEEQRKNADLLEEIHKLKAKILNFESGNAGPAVDKITAKLKKELDSSAQMDENIINAVSDQSLSSISETQDVEVYRKHLAKYKALNKQLLKYKAKMEKDNYALEQQCGIMQQNLAALQLMLEKERNTLKDTEIADCQIIEQLRIHLDTAVDTKEELEKLLESEKMSRKVVEEQLAELQAKATSESTESTKYKNLPSKETIELNRLREVLETIKREKDNFVTEIRRVNQTKNELESSLKNVNLQLEIQKGFSKSLEDKLEKFTNQQAQLTQQLLQKKMELEQRVAESEKNKILMDELEQETAHLKKQKSELLSLLKSRNNENIENMAQVVPEAIQTAIKELREKTEENKKNLEYIKKVQNEKRFLENQLIKAELRIKNNNNNVPYRDLAARSDYLFAKTLKLESVRKSLIWQKRYLVDYLLSHQMHCLIEPPVNVSHDQQCLRRNGDAKSHFRSAVFVVISILRMKFLVKRWHSGIRIAEKVNSRHHNNPMHEEQFRAAQFHVGQPVSSQHFSANLIRTSNSVMTAFNVPQMMGGGDSNLLFEMPTAPRPMMSSTNSRISEDLPWSGASPPSKEPRNRLGTGATNVIKEDATPLKAPQLLAQFAERFDQIQEKLSLALDANLSSLETVQTLGGE